MAQSNRINRSEWAANTEWTAPAVASQPVDDIAARNARMAAVLIKRDADMARAARVNRVCRLACFAIVAAVMVATFYGCTN